MEMDEKTKLGIQKSDKSLLFMKYLLLVAAIVVAVLGVITGIIAWCSGFRDLILSGFVYFFGGPLTAFVAYCAGRFALFKAYDVKLIRNKMYEIPNSEDMDKFVGSDEGIKKTLF